jgi:DNA topoisomerase-1
VIVESPAKAKTIGKILGKDFTVESSIGHIRDLPASASEIPAAYKTFPWARLGVDVENDFKPLYVVSSRKKDQVKKLKQLVKSATEVYIATDEDREGESIAWHLLEVLAVPQEIPVKRMVFHEITATAVKNALNNPRDLDRRLVDAQEGRRILDRLYGYEVSPVLWKKVLPKLSAGRVQSVATRLIVDLEKARMKFRAAGYWDVEGQFHPTIGDATPFGATLVSLDGERLATGKDFDDRGSLVRASAVVLDEAKARELTERLTSAKFNVRSVEEKPYRRSPYAPFITSTLQQEGGRKLGFTAKRTMQAAQRLYENGYITYMRTDSTTLSSEALKAARSQAQEMYGKDYIPDQPRQYTGKVKNAQEAHEAIRPAGESFRLPADVARELTGDEARLYDLIWKRTVASQMKDATGQSVQVRLGANTGREDAEFAASGKVITFPGFLRAYVEGSDDPDAALEDREVRLPQLRVGQELAADSLEPKEHVTQPPARYSEARLVKELEERGIGRPSTYASIIGTILDRGYVWKRGSALVPAWKAFSVVQLLERNFPRLVDYDFTASMEQDLDEIATGEEETVPWLKKFYFGNGEVGLHQMVSDEKVEQIDRQEINTIEIGDDADGTPITVRVWGDTADVWRGEQKAGIPTDLAPDELTVARAIELLEAPSQERVLGEDEHGETVHLKVGRFGPYVQIGEMEVGSKTKPPTASLLKTMDPATVSLEDALKLLALPRSVGKDPETSEEIEALNGRYGPYLKKGKDTRSLETEDQIFTVTLEEALALYAQPKQGRRNAATVLKELGKDEASGSEISIKDGRFGPYVTDGETNASLPRGTSPESMTMDRALEMLAERRAKGPVKRKKKTTARKKATRKKATKKKA